MIFEKMLGTCHVVVDFSGASNTKFFFDLLLFHLAHGKTRPQKTPKIPKKGLKSAIQNFVFDILKVSPVLQSLFLILFKSEK